jgi:hypothetical protein
MFTDEDWESYSKALREWTRVCVAHGATLIECHLALQPDEPDPVSISLTMGGTAAPGFAVDTFVNELGDKLASTLRAATDKFAAQVEELQASRRGAP